MKKTALVPLAEGFEEVEAVTIIDLLRRADIEVTIASLSPELLVKGAHGIPVQADTPLGSVLEKSFSAVILPGGMPGTTNLGKSTDLEKILLAQKEHSGWIGAICAAPTVLAKYDLLTGKNATSYPGFEDALTGALVSSSPVVEDEKLLTSRGPGTAILFSLRIIEKLRGEKKAEEIKAAGPSLTLSTSIEFFEFDARNPA